MLRSGAGRSRLGFVVPLTCGSGGATLDGVRTLLVLVEVAAALFGPFALATAWSRRRQLARGVSPRPAYPGDDPLVTPGAVIVGSLAGYALIVLLGGQVAAFNDWLLSLG